MPVCKSQQNSQKNLHHCHIATKKGCFTYIFINKIFKFQLYGHITPEDWFPLDDHS